MKVHSRQIKSYIDYLKSAGFFITLHGAYIDWSNFLEYNYHQNPYCHYIKSVYGKWEHCISRQEKVIKMCEDGSFFGCCYAGVGEYVYPVKNEEKIVCFISVSGFIGKETKSKAEHFAKKYGIDHEKLLALIDNYLSTDIPEKALIDAVIYPLVLMLETYFLQKRELSNEEALLHNAVLRYVTENCHTTVTMKKLSEHFNYSISTISHLFFKKTGKSLPAYVDEIRLNEAKWYLENSQTSITEIAVFLGYSSSNYFSLRFKKKFGVTPKEYRKKMNLLKVTKGTNTSK